MPNNIRHLEYFIQVVVAIATIGVLVIVCLANNIDREIVYTAISVIAALSGYQIALKVHKL